MKLKNCIRMIKYFSIAFLETTVETTRWELTNIGAVDIDLIEKEISVTTKKEREASHRWTPADQFKILFLKEVRDQIPDFEKKSLKFI